MYACLLRRIFSKILILYDYVHCVHNVSRECMHVLAKGALLCVHLAWYDYVHYVHNLSKECMYVC